MSAVSATFAVPLSFSLPSDHVNQSARVHLKSVLLVTHRPGWRTSWSSRLYGSRVSSPFATFPCVRLSLPSLLARNWKKHIHLID